jgi:quercetin dioxygenase-like cupin family protein
LKWFRVARNNVMTSEQEKIKGLKRQGYGPVYVWDAEPNEEDPDHTHPFDTCLVVLVGEIEIGMDGKSIILKSGNAIDIPREKIHYGKVGAQGCKYIVAEKH